MEYTSSWSDHNIAVKYDSLTGLFCVDHEVSDKLALSVGFSARHVGAEEADIVAQHFGKLQSLDFCDVGDYHLGTQRSKSGHGGFANACTQARDLNYALSPIQIQTKFGCMRSKINANQLRTATSPARYCVSHPLIHQSRLPLGRPICLESGSQA